MSLSATIPIARAEAANAQLEALGFGPANFSVKVKVNPNAQATHMALQHTAPNPEFEAAVAALVGVKFRLTEGLTVEFAELLAEAGLPVVSVQEP